jgi:hypothetical protein
LAPCRPHLLVNLSIDRPLTFAFVIRVVIVVDEEVLKVFIYAVPPNLGRQNMDGGGLYTNSFPDIFLRCIKGTWGLIMMFCFL